MRALRFVLGSTRNDKMMNHDEQVSQSDQSYMRPDTYMRVCVSLLTVVVTEVFRFEMMPILSNELLRGGTMSFQCNAAAFTPTKPGPPPRASFRSDR